ncbi:hypothetical protein CHLRE_12g529850v5 [Chlamydomonas reinhardtii]|uniref:Ion transport domain-containing protein n=1 Tax=Chlamydomonas reinhardtii TaxID=3055 RepID=A0A2K3D4R3_CHLRE|nr:uncharacterized protein CHLRE_12g529850v5 [Chlamydomonas reinhardtii]PNW75519.1 hypothetical protein CHLRE_12g529850v5 [Chlamydomonas reinhardtii]
MSSLVRPHEPRNEHANDASSAAPPTYRSASSAWAVPSAGRAPAFESPVEGQAPSLAASHSGPSPAREAAALAVNDDAARTGLVKLANGVALPLGAVQSIRAGSHSASAYGLATAPPPESVANLEDLDRQCALKQLHSGHGLAGSSGPAAAPVLCSFPTADPDYDEGRVAEAANLAAKYGGMWLRGALAKQRNQAQTRLHPVFVGMVRHVDGSMDLVRAGDMQPLQAGSLLFTDGEAELLALHPQLPSNLYFFPANMYDYGTAERQYVTVHFAAPGRLYVLLPEDTAEPRWLREQFFKVREPLYGVKVRLSARWKMGFVTKVLANMMTHKSSADERVLVYKSKRLYRAGDVVHLGGLPTARFTDTMYVVCTALDGNGGLGGEDGAADAAKAAAAAATAQLVTGCDEWGVWLTRLLKSIRRNRVEDARALLDTDCWRQRAAQGDPLSWLPPEEVGLGESPLTSDLAAASSNVEMLALLVAHGRCQLSFRGVRLLVRRWEEVPAKDGGALELLLTYIRRCPRPLSTVACMLMALRWEVELRDRARTASSQELRVVLRRFQELQVVLLEGLADVARTGGPDGSSSMSLAWLSGVLDPPQSPPPVSLGDYSPLRIAFEDRDYGFMASAVAEAYTRQKWLGASYLSLTPRDGSRELTLLDPLVLHTVLHKLGLVDEGLLSYLAETVTRLWFLSWVVPAAFLSSPRGRWCMRLLAGLCFIVMYNELLLMDPEAQLSKTVTTGTALCLWLFGNVIEAMETVAAAYGGRLAKYIKANPQEFFFLLCESLMLSLCVGYLLVITETAQMQTDVFVRLTLVWCSLAVPVFLKFLYMLVPMFQRLGPLLNTVYNMMQELVAFALPFAVITTGFATSFYIVHHVVPGGESMAFVDVMLMYFSAFLGAFDLHQWDDLVNPELRIFGITLMVVYLIIAGILLANLLIAIISYKYRPDQVAAQSVFGLAEVVDRHQIQVDCAMLCSPFCLLQLPFRVLPRGSRPAILPYTFYRMGLPPLEGFRPAAPHMATVPTGRDAVPQLLFHLTLHPLMLAGAAVAFLAISPLLVLRFGLVGHRRMLDRLWSGSGGSGSGRAGSSNSDGVGGGGTTRKGSVSMGVGNGTMSSQGAVSVASGGGRSRRSGGGTGSGGLSGSFGSEDPSLGLQAAGAGDPWKDVGYFCTLRGLPRLASLVGRVVVAHVVGLAAVLAMALIFFTAGSLYLWAVSTLLALYNVLYEPLTRFGSVSRRAAFRYRRAIQQWRKQRTAVADSSGRAGHAGDDGGSEAGTGIESGNDAASDAGSTSTSARRRSTLTASQVAQRWSTLTKGAAQQRQRAVASGRYLTRQHVEQAVLRVFGIGWEAAAKAEGADDTASGGAGVRARSLVPGPAARFGAGADDVSSVHVHSSPHLNMKSLEEQEASRDLRALGRMSSLAANAAAGTAATVGAASARRGAAAGKRAVAAVLPAAAVEEGVAPGGSFRAAGNAGRMVSELAGASGPAAMNGDVHKLAEALCRPLQEQLQQIQAALSSRLDAQATELGQLQEAMGALREVMDASLHTRDDVEQRRRSVLARAYGDENY